MQTKIQTMTEVGHSFTRNLNLAEHYGDVQLMLPTMPGSSYKSQSIAEEKIER